MTQIKFKSGINPAQMNILLSLFNSWNVEAEVLQETSGKQRKKHALFSETFGIWADRDIDIKEIRRKSYERRTKFYDNATL